MGHEGPGAARDAGGRKLLDSRVFDHAPVPPQWQDRFGATVPPSIAREAIAVLPVQGAGVVEIAPVGIADVPQVCAAAVGRRCRVTALAATPAAADAVAPYVDAVSFPGEAGWCGSATPR